MNVRFVWKSHLAVSLIGGLPLFFSSCSVILNYDQNYDQSRNAARSPKIPALSNFSISINSPEDRYITLGPRSADNRILEYSIVQQPSHGTINIESVSTSSIFSVFSVFNEESVRAFYRPRLPYVAQDSFTYSVSNGLESSEPIQVQVDIAPQKSLFESIGDYLDLPLPQGLRLSIDLPLTESPDINITNQSGIDYHPIAIGSPSIQSSTKRPGKSFAAYTPGTPEGLTEGRWSFGAPNACNSLINGSFALQAWVYLPQSKFTGFFVPIHDWLLGGNNIFYGGGGPDSFAPRIGVYEDSLGQRRLTIQSLDVDSEGQPIGPSYIRSQEVFPFDQWVHVAVTYDQSSNTTILYSDGFEVARDENVTYHHSGPIIEYNLGSAEYNWWWAFSWRGYISNFRLYTPESAVPCNVVPEYE